MAIQKKATEGKDFTLHFFSAQSSEEELQTALSRKWDWVISSPRRNAAWYTLLINNLHQTARLPDEMTMESVRQSIAKGIKRSAFDRLKVLTQASGEELAQVVGIPPRTLSRRTTFHPDESERILRVAAAFQRTIEVFEDLEKARRWFSTPQRSLGGQTPLRYCDTEVGAGEVVNLLGRIDHGVFT